MAAANEEPKAKGRQKASKVKAAEVKAEASDDLVDEKPKRSGRKTESKVKVEEPEDEIEVQPKRKGRKANSRVKVEEPEDDIEEQPKRNGRKRIPNVKMEDSEDEVEEDPKPKKRSRKTKVAMEGKTDEPLAETGETTVEDERPTIANRDETLPELAPESADEDMRKPKGRKKASGRASKATKVEKAPSTDVSFLRDRHNRFR